MLYFCHQKKNITEASHAHFTLITQAKELKKEFHYSQKGEERGTWFIYTDL